MERRRVFRACFGPVLECYPIVIGSSLNGSKTMQGSFRDGVLGGKKVGQTARQTDTLTEIDNSKAKILNIKKVFLKFYIFKTSLIIAKISN